MNTLDRIKQYIDYIGITNAAFERKIGFSNGAFASQLKNKGTIGVDKLEKILLIFPDINAEWLLTGRGNMLKSGAGETPGTGNETEKDTLYKRIEHLEEMLKDREKEIERLMKIIEMITGYAEHPAEETEKDDLPAHRKTG